MNGCHHPVIYSAKVHLCILSKEQLADKDNKKENNLLTN